MVRFVSIEETKYRRQDHHPGAVIFSILFFFCGCPLLTSRVRCHCPAHSGGSWNDDCGQLLSSLRGMQLQRSP